MDKSAIIPAFLAAVGTIAIMVGFISIAATYPAVFYGVLGVLFFGAVVYFFYGLFRDAR